MNALKTYINKSFFEKVLTEIEKVVKTFLVSDKLFSKLIYLKLVYYYVPLRHASIKHY